MNGRALPPSLVALTPGDLVADGDVSGGTVSDDLASDGTASNEIAALLLALERAVSGGLAGLLVREPSLSDRALLALAIAARERLGANGWLAVHDRVHLARACGADAVHLGFRSLTPRVVRGLVDERVAIGLSAHLGDARATTEGADYVFVGPVRATPKQGVDLAPIGVEGFAAGARALGLPAWAIGGLEPGDAHPLRDVGAAGLAVRRGVLGASDPAAAVRAHRAAWEAGR